MRPIMPVVVVLIATGALLMSGCEQQQPVTQKAPPPAGFKEGETPPVEPDRVRPTVERQRDAEPEHVHEDGQTDHEQGRSAHQEPPKCSGGAMRSEVAPCGRRAARRRPGRRATVTLLVASVRPFEPMASRTHTEVSMSARATTRLAQAAVRSSG